MTSDSNLGLIWQSCPSYWICRPTIETIVFYFHLIILVDYLVQIGIFPHIITKKETIMCTKYKDSRRVLF